MLINKNPGNKIGKAVELKYGAPTDILLLVRTSIIIGYIVPNKIVVQAISITILLITSAEVLFINNKFNFFGDSFALKINKIKENPVIIKKIINIKIPLEESLAKECTLVKIPERTKKVPNILSEKQSIERNTIQRFKSCSF